MTNAQLESRAKQAHGIFLENLGTGKNTSEWLTWLDRHCSKEGGMDSEWVQVYRRVEDLIEPGSPYGVKKQNV